MKTFLKNVVQRREGAGGVLIGRTVKVGPFTVRVEAHLADGGFACIYKVRDVASGQSYAMKHMRLMGEADAIADCMTEVNTLKKLRDVASVVTLRAAAFSGTRGNEQEAYLILDLCKENLVEYVQAQGSKLSSSTVIQIFSAVAQAVSAMHQQKPPWAHRDLKAENVLQNQDGDWVLCDFGSVTDKVVLYESSNAVMMGEEIIRKYTTPSYRAPEMWDLYSRDRIDTKADIWALGCLLYYLMFGKLAFQAEAKLQILNGDVLIPPTRPPPLVSLLKELLIVNPLQRPDILTVLRRLQEVADAMNVDPALLVPRQSAHKSMGATLKAAPLSGHPTPNRADINNQPPPASSKTPRPSTHSSNPSLQHQTSAPRPQVPSLQPQLSALQPQGSSLQSQGSSLQHQGSALPQQGSNTQRPSLQGPSTADAAAPRPEPRHATQAATASIPPPPPSQRTLSFTSRTQPSNSQGSSAEQVGFANFPSPPEQAGFANFADFDDPSPSPAAKSQEDEPQRLSASPPKTQRRGSSRQSSLKSIDSANAQGNTSDVASLKKLVGELQVQVQQLQALVRSQQATVKQLQVDNFNHVSQLKRLGLDPSPSVLTSPPIAAPPLANTQNAGWASFGSPPAFDSSPASDSPLAPLRTATSIATDASGDGRGSPNKARLSIGHIPRSPVSQSYAGVFDAFARGSVDATPNSLSNPDSAQDSPSDTMSRHSALSAFAESLKQPALMAEADNESPLSDTRADGKVQKASKRSHRRSTSEPAAMENWSLVEDQ